MRLFRTMMLVLCAAAGACQATAPVVDEKALSEQGWAHVREGESRKAIADFTQVIALDPEDYEGYISRGIAAYLSGDDQAALDDFNRAKPLEPYGSYQALTWFMLTARRMNQTFGGAHAVEAQRHSNVWPGPVQRFLVHVLSERQLLDAAETVRFRVPIDRRRCQAFFHIGEAYSFDGRLDQARLYLAKARDTCAVDLPESAAAWAELKRLQGSEQP